MISTRYAPVSLLGFALLAGCSAGDSASGTRPQQLPQQPTPQPAQNTAGTVGAFGDAMRPPLAGSAAPTPQGPPTSCRGGKYAGTYKCDLQVLGIPASLDGAVSFVLETAQTAPVSGCQEFCPDLVIADGSGTLFGLAGETGWGFEGKLDGGLDCSTGEFRATAPKGIYGITGSENPFDPAHRP